MTRCPSPSLRPWGQLLLVAVAQGSRPNVAAAAGRLALLMEPGEAVAQPQQSLQQVGSIQGRDAVPKMDSAFSKNRGAQLFGHIWPKNVLRNLINYMADMRYVWCSVLYLRHMIIKPLKTLAQCSTQTVQHSLRCGYLPRSLAAVHEMLLCSCNPTQFLSLEGFVLKGQEQGDIHSWRASIVSTWQSKTHN